MIVRHEGGGYADHNTRIGTSSLADQLDAVAEVISESNVDRVQRVNALVRHIVDGDLRVEGNRGEDRDLGGGVATGHILRGIGLGEAKALCLGQHGRIVGAVGHLREHEVCRAVDDAEDRVDLARDHRLAQDLDDGNGGADAGLEAQLDAVCLGRGEQLRAVAGEQLLVCRDDRLAGCEQFEHPFARGRDTAHHFCNDANRRIVTNHAEVVGEQTGARFGVALRREIPHERTTHLDGGANHALHVRLPRRQQTINRRADGAIAKESDADGCAAHMTPQGSGRVRFVAHVGEQPHTGTNSALSRPSTGLR